jgi:hypothetical protein
VTRDPAPDRDRAEQDAGEVDRVRRRRAEVFGDVLPEGTTDEQGGGWSEREPAGEPTDEWLRRQVPPHHG